METIFECYQCKQTITHKSDLSTGYGRDKDDNKICFACCGINDRKQLLSLKPREQMTLYFSGNQVTNWPGSLKVKPFYTKESRHNIGRTRTDFWFSLENKQFHGYQIGDSNEIAHVYKLK